MNQQEWDDAFFARIAEAVGTDEGEGLRGTVEPERRDELREQYPDDPASAADDELQEWAGYGE